MIFIATMIGIVIAMLLMALGVFFGRTALRNGCGKGCDCLADEHQKRLGRIE
jgi:UPF0716 family protein affecting phage T7 exclusion